MAEDKPWTVIQFGDPIKGANEGIDKAINETLAKIRTEAVSFAPADKGRLRNSIMYRGPGIEAGFNELPGKKAKSGDKITSVATDGVGYIGSNLDYAVYQEYGTKNMKPQPFLGPAVAKVSGEGLEDIAKTINEQVKKWTEDSTKRKEK